MMQKKILVIGTLDTKGKEFGYLCSLIKARGHETMLVNVGAIGEPTIKPDISASTVAMEAGIDLTGLRSTDRREGIEIIIRGIRSLVLKLYSKQEFHGVISIGGGTGTNIATAAMRVLPIGVPKLMVSSVASADVSPYVDIKDITMMHSVIDVSGLNRISTQILSNAAGAICGMVEQEPILLQNKPLIAASMFGVTTPCVTEVQNILEKYGLEVIVFHANGKGGRAMEDLIEGDFFSGVADITTTEWADEMVGGDLTAGSDRLGAASRKGIPQIVSCGALDIVNFRLTKPVPVKFANRIFYQHHPNVVLMRTTAAECREIGEMMANKLNEAKGPVILIIPLNGLSMIDKPGQPFFDPDANNALFSALRENIKPPIKIIECNMHINDQEFARSIADNMLALLGKSTLNTDPLLTT